jgi:hypothetical protein
MKVSCVGAATVFAESVRQDERGRAEIQATRSVCLRRQLSWNAKVLTQRHFNSARMDGLDGHGRKLRNVCVEISNAKRKTACSTSILAALLAFFVHGSCLSVEQTTNPQTPIDPNLEGFHFAGAIRFALHAYRSRTQNRAVPSDPGDLQS